MAVAPGSRAWAQGRLDPKPRWKSKLTPEQRHEIRTRKEEGATFMGLALEYGVTARYIRDI